MRAKGESTVSTISYRHAYARMPIENVSHVRRNPRSRSAQRVGSLRGIPRRYCTLPIPAVLVMYQMQVEHDTVRVRAMLDMSLQ